LPFKNGSFDIIFSNYVIEYIDFLDVPFYELRRIGGERCICFFAVPINIWVLLVVDVYPFLLDRVSEWPIAFTTTFLGNLYTLLYFLNEEKIRK